MSNFDFLDPEWPELLAPARRAEELVHADPRAACFYARRTLELTVAWLYTHDAALRLPYQEHLAALLAEPSFQQAVGPAISAKAKVIKDLGNRAVHRPGPIKRSDAVMAVRELYHICYWLGRTYGRRTKPAPGAAFDADKLPTTSLPPRT